MDEDAFRKAVTLHGAGRLAEAQNIYKDILARNPAHFKSAHHLGIAALQQHDYAEALRLIDVSLGINPDQPLAHSNRAAALRALKRDQEALNSYDRVLVLRPNDVQALVESARILVDLNRHDEAMTRCDQALALKPDHAEAHVARGRALEALKRYPEAVAAYDAALAQAPNLKFVRGAAMYAALQSCDWKGIDDRFNGILSEIDAGRCQVVGPGPLLATPASPAQLQKVAAYHFRDDLRLQAAPWDQPRRSRGQRIHVGYFSADFYNHAIGNLTAGLFESHDRARFEVSAFLLTRGPADAMQERIKNGFDRFIDVSTMADHEIAGLSRDLKIDIAIDLMGYSARSRPGIFAARAAPIQANYLGYPGTMGTTCMDYIIADPLVILPHTRSFFTEQVAYMPHSYQVNDLKRPWPDRIFTRRALGLPEKGFVFCCFNGNYKLTPDVFDIWMRLLAKVDRSVLWLLRGSDASGTNLKNEAVKSGIAPERIVFADFMDMTEHLARYRAADLVLDTFYYGAHTTASDALWMGTPVVTKPGNTFASRVGASLLTAAGLPDLIAETAEAYEAIAVDLATHPDKLAAVKQRLLQNRLTCPLFDTRHFTRNIEAAYDYMMERHEAGAAPGDFHVMENII